MNEKKILIIEDDTILSSMYEIKLKQEGFIVIRADDGAQGINIAKSEKPDLILLDVILPQLDGFSVIRELKEDKSIKDIPVIMLTNLGTNDDVEKGEEMGAVDYLVKANNTPAQVSQVIKKHLKL
jgi:DNA-binding response OmpR family regulator